jgi:hypothetical protein
MELLVLKQTYVKQEVLEETNRLLTSYHLRILYQLQWFNYSKQHALVSMVTSATTVAKLNSGFNYLTQCCIVI